MREPQEITINGRVFSVAPLPAMRALKLYPLIAKGWMRDKDNPLELLTDTEMERVAKGLLELTRVDGKELWPVIDLELQGDIPSLMELLAFAVKVNYSRFSAGSAGPGQPTGQSSEG